jgi:hypothetical protein
MDEHDKSVEDLRQIHRNHERFVAAEEARRLKRQANLAEELERRRYWASDEPEKQRNRERTEQEAEWRRERRRENWIFLITVVGLGVVFYVILTRFFH